MNEKKLKRKDTFFGVHFDYHAGVDCDNIGTNVTEEMIQRFIDEVKPDYIQCDAKGHMGYASFKSEYGTVAPGVKKDALKVFRTVTEKNNVGLFAHYSGIWDKEAIKANPNRGVVNKDGTVSSDMVSLFSDYQDAVMIPQLIELCDKYKLDGVWVDGDCWALDPDYSEKALSEFSEEIGEKVKIEDIEEKYEQKFKDFNREKFRKYLRKNLEVVHSHNKDFQYASNWAFSSFMPEKVCADVDFISGDYPMTNSVNVARYEARCVTKQGKPWDVMVWAFTGREFENVNIKSPVQIMREASIVTALGGGVMLYYTQDRDGSIKNGISKTMSQVGEFLRQRREFCHGVPLFPQVGILYSSYSFYKDCPYLLRPGAEHNNSMKGMLECIVEMQYSAELVSEHHLEENLCEYPVIVLPECKSISPEFKQKLLNYVENGGNLLISGIEMIKEFENVIGADLGTEDKACDIWVEQEERRFMLKTNKIAFTPKKESESIGTMYFKDDDREAKEQCATITSLGKGKIATIYFEFGNEYMTGKNCYLKRFVKNIIKKIFKNPVIEVSGSELIDVTVQKKQESLIINLINTSGAHDSKITLVYDEITPLYNLQLKIRCNKEPTKVLLQPENKILDYVYDGEFVQVDLDKLEIHSIIEIK